MTEPLEWLTCAATGKRGYLDRKTAKLAAKRTPGGGLDQFLCEHCGRWHNGHLASPIKRGRQARGDQMQSKRR